jgi:hypothetical protein
MATLENLSKNYSDLIQEVTSGQIKIPQFQRQFVWHINASAKLLDSILKGYPIGTFIFWRTDEELRAIRNIGTIDLPSQTKGEFVNYVLDGQQRITSFYAAFRGQKIKREKGKIEDFAQIYIDLDASPDDEIVITDISKKLPNSFISLLKLMEGDFQYLNSFPQEYHEKIKKYQNVIRGYNFNVINLKQAPIEVATEVFTRLNVGGKSLSLFEIMVAKTYDASTGFDLSEKYHALKEELEPAQYSDIPAATVLQVVSMLLEKDVTRKAILKLDKHKFIAMWDEAIDCIKSAIEFFRGYGIVVSRLLPYPALIVPFSYFFHKHKSPPTGETKKRLEDYFWRSSLGARYSSGVESKLANDVTKIDDILAGKLPKYEWAINISPENLKDVDNGWFTTGRSFIKAILCLYAQQKPKSFNNNQDVIIDNSWLKVSTSKNYHHFFPRAYMKKYHSEIHQWLVNNVLNITIVDDFLNKNVIKAKAPSDYMGKFIKQNSDINKTMATHLIGDFESFGIADDNFEKFINERAKWVSQELKNRIIEQVTGHETQEEILEETDEDNSAFEAVDSVSANRNKDYSILKNIEI